jgi:uncharacterized membrane protein
MSIWPRFETRGLGYNLHLSLHSCPSAAEQVSERLVHRMCRCAVSPLYSLGVNEACCSAQPYSQTSNPTTISNMAALRDSLSLFFFAATMAITCVALDEFSALGKL